MRLKQFLKNSARPALLYYSLLICLLVNGCSLPPDTFYAPEDIPGAVQQFCESDYRLNAVAHLNHNVLWIYLPLKKVLHQDFGPGSDKIFDEKIGETLNNVLTAVGRVIMNTRNPPEFVYVLLSDIEVGIDYSIIGSTLDIRKTYSGVIPSTESNKRYLVSLLPAPKAIGDTQGTHLDDSSPIELSDFLAKQIAQRIISRFQEQELSRYFRIEKAEGRFEEGRFLVEYALKEIQKPKNTMDADEVILNIVSYCLQSYEFLDFSFVETFNLITQERNFFNRASVWQRPLI